MKHLPILLALGLASLVQAQEPQYLHQIIENPARGNYEHDNFGSSIATWSNFAVIGSPRASVLESPGEQGEIAVFESMVNAPAVFGRRMTYGNPNLSGGKFGQSVAILSQRVFAGAPENPISGQSLAGEAYMFDYSTRSPAPVLTFINPNPQGFERFGYAVAAGSGHVAISSVGLNTPAANAGQVHVFNYTKETAPLVYTLPNPTPAAGEFFGSTLAAEGNVLVVGNSMAENERGEIHIYNLASGELIRTVVSPAAEGERERFGAALSLKSNMLAIGAPHGAGQQGRVYVYNLGGSTPDQPIHIIENPEPGIVGEFFGSAVAISYPDLLVGNPGDVRNGANQYGCSHRYDLASATPGIPVFKGINSTPTHGEGLGSAVGLLHYNDVSMNLVGVPNNSTIAPGAGAVGYWRHGNSTIQYWTYPKRRIPNGFGTEVAMDGTRIAVGSPSANLVTTNAGRVDIYDRTSINPGTPVMTLAPPEAVTGDEFGSKIALSGRHLAVAAPPRDAPGGYNTGRVYIYDFEYIHPTLPRHILDCPEPILSYPQQNFGRVMDLENGTLAITQQASLTKEGKIFVYDLSSNTPTEPVLVLTHPKLYVPQDPLKFGAALSLSGRRLAVAAIGNDTKAQLGGRVFIYDLSSETPQTPILTIPSPIPGYNTEFGASLAFEGDRLVATVMEAGTSATRLRKVVAYDLSSATPTTPAFELGTLPDDTTATFGTMVSLEGDTIIAQFNNTTRRYDWASTPPGAVAQVFAGDVGATSMALSEGWLAAGNPNTRVDYFIDGVVRVYSPPYSEIAVLGNGVNILSGDSVPGLADHTDFGRVALGKSLQRDFTVRNFGPAPLAFTDAPANHVTISGPDAAHFTISDKPTSPLEASGAAALGVRFTPLTEGVKTAMVTVRSDDSDEPVFTFAISGEGRFTSPAGENWTEHTSSGQRVWTHLCASADGSCLYATTTSGHIHLSKDSGETWTMVGGGLPCTGIACSTDGTRIAVAVEGGPIYVSADAGTNWSPVETARAWSAIACSADGMRLVAVEAGGLIHSSPDHGATWTTHETARDWNAVTVSANGALWIATEDGGQIHVSGDTGATWSAHETARAWKAVACSADGSVVAAVADNTPIMLSKDQGATWTSSESARAWSGVTISNNGAHLAASSSGSTGRVYVSTDGGQTWSAEAHEADWRVLAGSADGGLLAAGVHNQSIWTSSGVVDPVLNVVGNGILIANGDATPDLADGTDFGGTPATAGFTTRTFAVRNPGSVPLHLTDSPPVKISGANAGDFLVEVQPSSVVPPVDGATQFTVRFDPAALGERSAIITIASDDSEQNPHSFTIRGTGILGTYTLTPVTSDNGSISPLPPQEVTEGQTRTFTAFPDDGFLVDRWLVNGEEAQAGGTSFTTAPIVQATTVTVLFKPNPEAPEFVTHPAHTLAYLGGPATFSAEVTGGEPMTYQWKKGAANIATATSATLSLPTTVAGSVGAYSLVVDNDQSPPVASLPGYLGLVTRAAATQAVRRGTTLTLRCAAVAPAAAGVTLSYAWQFNGQPLVDGPRPNGSIVSNATKATLSLTKADFEHEGVYSCLVTLNTPGNDPSLSAGDIQVRVLGDLPVMEPVPLPLRVIVSQTLEAFLTATGLPTGFSASGLPIGLTLDTKTGRISGKPKKASKRDAAGNYIPDKITLRATNVWGVGPPTEFLLVVEALPDSQIGTFTGVVARSPHTNFGHGGLVQLTIGSNGAISGSATLAGQRHVLAGELDAAIGSPSTANFSFLRAPTTLRNLNLEFTVPAQGEQIQGLFTDPGFIRLEGSFEAGQAALPGLEDSDFFSALLRLPGGILVTAEGTGYVADTGNHAIRFFDLNTRSVQTLAGSGVAGSADGVLDEATFNLPQGLAMDAAGNLFVADAGNHCIRKITPAGVVSTFAGAAGQAGSSNGTALAARFNKPTSLCFDATGNLYIVDQGNHTIRKITPAGLTTTHAGMAGVAAHKEGMGAAARFNTPTSIAYEPTLKYLFVTDTGNKIVRQVALNGATYTYAGSPGVSGTNDGLALNARFTAPLGITARGDGTLYVSDTVIRQINRNGTVGTVTATIRDDDHPAALAWHAESASLLAVHDTLHSLSIQQQTTHDRDAVFTAWRNTWTTTNTVPVEERARYNVSLKTTVPDDLPGYPKGSGYASVTVAGNGTAAWTGKTADGVGFTCSVVMTSGRMIPLHAMMLTNTASLQGETVLSPATSTIVSSAAFGFDWLKISQPLSKNDTSYKSGFPLHALRLAGGKYVPGSAHSYLELTGNATPMRLSFAESRISAFTQSFTLTAPSKVHLPANPRSFTLSVNGTTGIFLGTYRDGAPSLTANFTGILSEDPETGVKRGEGYVLLPDAPGTLRPVESSVVTLEAEPEE